jgi:hypothetical protein
MKLEEKANEYGNKRKNCITAKLGFLDGYKECKTDIIDFLNANQKATVKQVLDHLNQMK